MGRVPRLGWRSGECRDGGLIWVVGAALMFFSIDVNFGWITPRIS
jgi:hypothetical protein